MNKKDKPRVTVGDYEVVRRGSRIAVQLPGYLNHLHWNDTQRRYEDRQMPPTLELSFSQRRARELLRLPRQLLAEEKERRAVNKKLEANNDKINTLESKIKALHRAAWTLRQERDSLSARSERGYKITRTKNGGLQFGCTIVTKASLAAIKKLLDKQP